MRFNRVAKFIDCWFSCDAVLGKPLAFCRVKSYARNLPLTVKGLFDFAFGAGVGDGAGLGDVCATAACSTREIASNIAASATPRRKRERCKGTVRNVRYRT